MDAGNDEESEVELQASQLVAFFDAQSGNVRQAYEKLAERDRIHGENVSGVAHGTGEDS